MPSTCQKHRPIGFRFALAISITMVTVLMLAFAPRAGAFVYWTNFDDGGAGTSVARAGLDGSGLNTTFVRGGSPSLCGVAVDAAHLYWTNLENGTIGRANLDGSAVNQSFIRGAISPCGVAVDGAHIYWGNNDSNAIGRANLDGTQVNQSFITGGDAPVFVAVDAGHIYWANAGSARNGSIGRANLDGSGVNQRFISSPVMSGVAVDAAHIYWADADAGTIGRANLDGTGVNQSFISGGNLVEGVAVDGAHIYWTNNFPGPTGFDDDAIARANLDGSGVNQQFITGPITSPFGVAVDGAATATNGYPRPKGATPTRVSLVPAYALCAAPNRTHGAPLAVASCAPPVQSSAFLTVGTLDANGAAAKSVGSVVLAAKVGDPTTAADEADVRITASTTDVRLKSGLGDYTGQLQGNVRLRITDRASGPALNEPATAQDFVFPFTVPCQTTADTTVGSTCAVTTSADAIQPGAVRENARTIWQLGEVQLFDGGADGTASTTQGNTLFETQGVFVP
jgi:virginiamycin B lyase